LKNFCSDLSIFLDPSRPQNLFAQQNKEEPTTKIEISWNQPEGVGDAIIVSVSYFEC